MLTNFDRNCIICLENYNNWYYSILITNKILIQGLIWKQSWHLNGFYSTSFAEKSRGCVPTAGFINRTMTPELPWVKILVKILVKFYRQPNIQLTKRLQWGIWVNQVIHLKTLKKNARNSTVEELVPWNWTNFRPFRMLQTETFQCLNFQIMFNFKNNNYISYLKRYFDPL